MRESKLFKRRNSSSNGSLKLENDLPINCECLDHSGKELLNQTLNLTADYVFDCLFSRNNFNVQFAKLRKIAQIFTGEWKDENFNDSKYKVRKNEYTVALQGNFLGVKSCKNDVTEKILKSSATECYVVESDSISSGMTYADCFFVRTRFCITKYSHNSSKLLVHAQVVFIQKPIFFIKNIIEKSCITALDEYFKELGRCLIQESERLNKVPLILGNESNGSSVSSSPSVLSFSEKSSDLTDDLELNKLSENNNRSSRSILLNGNDSKYQNRSKSLDKNNISTSSTAKSRRSVKNSDSLTSDSIFQQNLNTKNVSSNDFNYSKSSSTPTKQNRLVASSVSHTKASSSNLCSNCNCDNANVNKNKTSKSRYFDADIFLKFFFIVMIFLLILNGVLYIKLKDIENIAMTMKRTQKLTSNSQTIA